MPELAKAYEPQKYESDIYKRWEESGFFDSDVCVNQEVTAVDAPYFSIVLPPPNVTGTLHMGHAVMLAIQDALTRYHRMKGDKTLWVPGTDHAAIATQTKVEKLLMEKEGMKDPRQELGREKFLERVEEYAQESHDTIVNQCRKMGASLDWSREAYTLDEERNLAVRTVFKKMYDDGLIYRGYRLVNWCPRCHSTLADDEVEYKEQKAKLYTFKYSPDFPFAISTTRPETKLGDTAVAVNPKDERYKKYIGQTLEVKNFAGGPDLKIKIIADEQIDTAFGTGAVGVTPAHSQADYEMARKNNLPVLKVIDEDGKMTKEAGESYAGLEVLAARKKVLGELSAAGLLQKEEEAPNNLSVCYRCGSAVEPLPSKQWFINVNKDFIFHQSASHPIKGIRDGAKVTLKKLMRQVVENKQIEIIPDRFNKVYFHWIDNLRDWCISRQIWFGHRIPVWYKGEEIYAGVEAPTGDGWKQDEDTLDTWFSSGLWTFSALDWPSVDNFVKHYHPTSVLETGYDILFFWVARMILMTTYTLGEIPFQKVYLHGLVRDEAGEKMSKSKGNVIDPLDMIQKYGADATRLSLLLGNTPGNDMRLSVAKIEGFRNFTNKLWNISRFMLLNIHEPTVDLPYPEAKTSADRWILQKMNKTVKTVTENLEKFNFSYAGECLREFTWSDLADWYLEVAKIEGDKKEILNYLLNTVLKLWHPFMPFVTEAVWEEIYGQEKMLMISGWPQYLGVELASEEMSWWKKLFGRGSAKKENDFELARRIVSGLRTLRADYKIEPVKKLEVKISAGKHNEALVLNEQIIKGLARLEKLEFLAIAHKMKNSVGFVESGVEVFVDLSGAVDATKEKGRLEKEVEQAKKYISGLEKKLGNAEFVKNAPAEIVAKEKEKLAEAKEKMEKLQKQLDNLK